MEPLIVLVVTTTGLLAAGAAGWRHVRSWHVALRGGLAAMLTFTGASHFGAFGIREELVAMVPPALPAPEVLVSITGVLELAGAFGLLVNALWPWAAAGLSALLVAMFPANIYRALEDPHLQLSQELAPRTALQTIFLAATLVLVGRYFVARSRADSSDPGSDSHSPTPHAASRLPMPPTAD